MIFIDSRTGSKDLVKLVEPSILVELESGDASFQGNGPNGTINIGIERKTINDMINSIQDGRLSGYQIPRMVERYQRIYLIVEGVCRGNPKTGTLEQLRGTHWKVISRGERRFSHEALWNYLSTLEEMAGVVVRNTADLAETANQIRFIYDWWQKPYSSHKSLNQIYKRQPRVIFSKPSLLRIIASDLPGVGFDISKIVEAHFETIDAMMAASEEEWREVPRIGKTIAKEVWKALHKK